jgi:uncharacterized membrane protein YjgN (DUF898 family)
MAWGEMIMADIEHEPVNDEASTAFVFHGNWKDFARIALPNLLLTIVTLGIYRFWATTREREYLWSQTQFIDERLEWTGKGLELLIGFVAAIILLGIPFLFIQFGAQVMILRGMPGYAIILNLLSLFALFWLIGVGRFRGIRYKLSRTYWRGIRGGSEFSGFSYGWSYVWKSFVGSLAAGLMVPWSMVNLWNERWGRMSFGPHEFNAFATQDGLMPRYLLIYLGAFIAIILTGMLGLEAADNPVSAPSTLAFLLAPLLLYGIIGLAGTFYYAKFFETVIGGMTLENLEFGFRASDGEWFKLIIGNVLLVIFTLGLGLVFVPYRNWQFMITHLEAYGTINLDTLTQSQTEKSKHGEGLLDAFDIGAI